MASRTLVIGVLFLYLAVSSEALKVTHSIRHEAKTRKALRESKHQVALEVQSDLKGKEMTEAQEVVLLTTMAMFAVGMLITWAANTVKEYYEKRVAKATESQNQMISSSHTMIRNYVGNLDLISADFRAMTSEFNDVVFKHRDVLRGSQKYPQFEMWLGNLTHLQSYDPQNFREFAVQSKLIAEQLKTQYASVKKQTSIKDTVEALESGVGIMDWVGTGVDTAVHAIDSIAKAGPIVSAASVATGWVAFSIGVVRLGYGLYLLSTDEYKNIESDTQFVKMVFDQHKSYIFREYCRSLTSLIKIVTSLRKATIGEASVDGSARAWTAITKLSLSWGQHFEVELRARWRCSRCGTKTSSFQDEVPYTPDNDITQIKLVSGANQTSYEQLLADNWEVISGAGQLKGKVYEQSSRPNEVSAFNLAKSAGQEVLEKANKITSLPIELNPDSETLLAASVDRSVTMWVKRRKHKGDVLPIVSLTTIASTCGSADESAAKKREYLKGLGYEVVDVESKLPLTTTTCHDKNDNAEFSSIVASDFAKGAWAHVNSVQVWVRRASTEPVIQNIGIIYGDKFGSVSDFKRSFLPRYLPRSTYLPPYSNRHQPSISLTRVFSQSPEPYRAQLFYEAYDFVECADDETLGGECCKIDDLSPGWDAFCGYSLYFSKKSAEQRWNATFSAAHQAGFAAFATALDTKVKAAQPSISDSTPYRQKPDDYLPTEIPACPSSYSAVECTGFSTGWQCFDAQVRQEIRETFWQTGLRSVFIPHRRRDRTQDLKFDGFCRPLIPVYADSKPARTKPKPLKFVLDDTCIDSNTPPQLRRSY